MSVNYYIYKFSSKKLDNKLEIKTTFDEAMDNKEIINIAFGQLIDSLLASEYNTSYPFNNKKNKIFIPEICNMIFENNKIYDKVANNGFILNGEKFVRFMASPSQTRKSTVMFIKESCFNYFLNKFLIGIDLRKSKINPSKFNAYFSLPSSGGVKVSKPRAVVIDDYEIKLEGDVNFVDDNNNVTTINSKELDFMVGNAFDGAGLISPYFAKVWSKDILKEKYNENHPFCSFVIRSGWMKGCLNTFDWIELAEYLKLSVPKIKDIWGKEYDIYDIDVILSKSMLKLNNDFYDSYEEYEKACEDNGIDWFITLTNKLEDDEMNTLNYQYLQTLDIQDEDIQDICKYSVDLINDVKGGNVEKLLLFLSSSTGTEIFNNDNTESFIKILMYYPEIIEDLYIKNKINNMIKNTVKKMSIGKLLVEGNYQIMITDPYAMAQHALGLYPTGLLNKRCYYSNFWNQKNETEVLAQRSPLTDFSENQILYLKNTNNMQKYYRYLYSGIIYPCKGMDNIVHSGADRDGDNIFTTNDKILKNRIMKSDDGSDIYPTCHSPQKAPKIYLIDKDGNFKFKALYEADKKAFRNEIGFVANYASSLFPLLERYPKDKYPKENKELRNRLTASYRESGNTIDKAKGITVTPFPKHWINKQKIYSTNSTEERELKEFNNKLAIVRSKKPLFMVNLYDKVYREYISYYNSQSDQAFYSFGKHLDDLMTCDISYLTKEEKMFLYKFEKYLPVFVENCVMNKIYKYIISLNLDKVKRKKNKDILQKIFRYNNKFPKNNEQFDKLKDIYEDFSYDKKIYKTEQIDKNNTFFINMFYNKIRNKIDNLNIEENLLFEWIFKLSYFSQKQNKDFLWEMYGDKLYEKLKNVIDNSKEIKIIKDENGDLEYLGKKYRAIVGE